MSALYNINEHSSMSGDGGSTGRGQSPRDPQTIRKVPWWSRFYNRLGDHGGDLDLLELTVILAALRRTPLRTPTPNTIH